MSDEEFNSWSERLRAANTNCTLNCTQRANRQFYIGAATGMAVLIGLAVLAVSIGLYLDI